MRVLLLKFSSVLESALKWLRSQIAERQAWRPGSGRPIMDAMGGRMLLRYLGLSALLAGAVGKVLAHGDGSFEAPLALRAPNAVCCTAGDFDMDGKLDLAAVSGTYVVTVWLQDHTNRRAWRRAPDLRVGFTCFFIRAADFDGDGSADLVIADPGSIAYYFRSKRDGTFEPPMSLPRAVGPRWVAVTDFDGDGKLDLATANHNQHTVTTFSGRGGEFALLGTFIFPSEPHAIEAIHFDGDGQIDLMVGLAQDGNLPLRGRGDGSFERGSMVQQFPCMDYIATGDFNGDALGDLAVGCEELSATWSVNLGNGVFGKPQSAPGWGVESTAVADLNGDGFDDIAVAGSEVRALSVYRGKGDGTFLPPIFFYATGTNPAFLIAGDLDGDGRNEVVSADIASSSLTIFWGTSGERFLEATHSITGFTSAGAMAIADVGLDGVPDLLVSRSNQPKVHVYRNVGSGNLDRPSQDLTPSSIYSTLEALDLDGDAVSDLAGTSYGEKTAAVALLDPSGNIRSEKAFPTGLLPLGIAAGRIDGDARIDLAVPSSGSNWIDVFLSAGGGDFAASNPVFTISGPRAMASGDLDGDGFPDLVLAGRNELSVQFAGAGSGFTDPLQLIRGTLRAVRTGDVNGDGRNDVLAIDGNGLSLFPAKENRQFGQWQLLSLEPNLSSLAIADIDGDGLVDVTAADAGRLGVFRNLGPGGLKEPRWYPLGITVIRHAIADLNQDGALDIVALSANQALVLFGRPALTVTGRFLRGDADGDGQLAITDPIAVLSRLFLGGEALPCDDAADSNDDGEVNLSDPITTLDRLFLGGEVLPPPGPAACGEDPTADALPPCGSCEK
jgi:hypothetical protein